MSKKKISLTKLKTVANKSGEKKQITISKFFSAPRQHPRQNGIVQEDIDSSVVVIDDDSPKKQDIQDTKGGRKRVNKSKAEACESKRKCFYPPHQSTLSKPVTSQDIPSTSYFEYGKGESNHGVSASTKSKLNKFQIDEVSNFPAVKDIKTFVPRQSLLDISIDDDQVDIQKGVISSSGNNSDDEQLSTSKSLTGLQKFAAATRGKAQVNKRTKTKYTPLEQQFLELKEKYPDTLLFVECGYKYRFFGEDAENAAEVLKIYCHQDHNFMTASIPVHRLFVHIRRLVAAGYKVGVVKQTETAALKACGDNKSGPFTRELSAMYTKSTLFVNTSEELQGEINAERSSSEYLMCVYDVPHDKVSKHQTIGILAVQPSTGDVIYDSFEDSDLRSQLETRILHIQPVELLTSKTLSDATLKLLSDIAALRSTDDDRLRQEQCDDEVFEFRSSFTAVSEFYKAHGKDPSVVQSVINLPPPVISCLAAVLKYLKDFGLQKALQDSSNFTQFSEKLKHLHLPGNTVRNLELFCNQNDGKERDSLYWLMNQTVTKFGGRKLKAWLTHPLMDIKEILIRQEAVNRILDNINSSVLGKFRSILGKSPDLERGLCSIFYEKSSVQEFYSVSRSLSTVLSEVEEVKKWLTDNLNCSLLQQIFNDIPDLLSDIKQFKESLNETAVKANDKTKIFINEQDFPDIGKRKKQIEAVRTEILDHRREIRLLLRQPSLDYVTVMGIEYLIEVKNAHINLVPNDWVRISSTKTVTRFHSPFIESKVRELSQLQEQLVLDSQAAWLSFLQQFNEGFRRYKTAVDHLATFDCLFSLAFVAKHQAFCRPDILADDICIEIKQGRHPVIQHLIGECGQYVANDTNLKGSSERVMIITGPNMGGKSSFIKQVAIICILAQIGSYVPADSARIGILDAIFTRMGAADEIFSGRSTFMVELQETSDILSQATSHSLVILDELGRGTSTHDGVAIAYATLDYFISKVQCQTLFVTHYPILAEFEKLYPRNVGNFHMGFIVHEDNGSDDEDKQTITFLYQLVRGMAARSYGLNVARLAGIPQSIIKTAAQLSSQLEDKIQKRRLELEAFRRMMLETDDNKLLQYTKTFLESNTGQSDPPN
ncbi:DNA mismatch repair protein Msh3-like [Saccostrea echinata]|uniref:DNA mismatch repair protein Msh3-like n=1 Tax=Saccostrea echinata TaxID=191078 RepID=UPI002A820615|nr:DNA mismatch repair protein Msh3-like [Saccostrea echinata]